MSLFTPPRPVTAPEKRSTLTQRIALLRSGLGTFREGSYGQKMGRHGFRTLPFLKKRWIFTVRDPELVREVLVRRAEDFPKSGLMDAMLRALTGYSIFVSNGEVWGRQRRLIDPALEQARVRDVFARMLEAAAVATARMEALADTGEPVRVDMEMTRFAADVIFRTIFSEPISDEAAERVIAAFEVFQGVAYAHGMLGLARAPSRILPGWGRARRRQRSPGEKRICVMRQGQRVLARRIADAI